jgi:hypothetical protein
MTFGGYNEEMISSDITWNYVQVNYSYWQIDINNATFGDQ